MPAKFTSDKARVLTALALTVALVATLASGQHHHIGLKPKARAMVEAKPFPSVTKDAVEIGCAAWGEPLSECVADQDTIFKYGGSPKF